MYIVTVDSFMQTYGCTIRVLRDSGVMKTNCMSSNDRTLASINHALNF